MAAVRDRRALCQADEPRLGGAVGLLPERRQPVDRRDVDDHALPALDHRLERRAGAQERTSQVDAQVAVPRRRVQLEQAAAFGDRGVVHEDVRRAELRVDPCEEPLDGGLDTYVDHDWQAAPADLVGDRLGRGTVDVGDDDAGALGRELARDHPPDARRAPGDHHHLVGEPPARRDAHRSSVL